MSRSNARSESGFTLIELLVALMILVLVLSGIYGAFHAGSQSTAALEEHTDLTDTARAVFAQLDTELDGLCRPDGSSSVALTGESSSTSGNSSGSDALQFTTTSHNPCYDADVRSDVCTVTYMCKKEANGTSDGLFVSEDFYPGLHDSESESDSDSSSTTTTTLTGTSTGTDLPVTKLSDLVVDMTFSYLDSDTEEWVDEWVDEENPPSAVKIKLTLKPSRKNAKSTTYTHIVSLPTWLESTSSSSDSSSDSSGSSTGGESGNTMTFTAPTGGGGGGNGGGGGGPQ